MRKRVRLGLLLGGEMQGQLELLPKKKRKVRGRVRVARQHVGMSQTFARVKG